MSLVLFFCCVAARAQQDLDQEPILYSTATSSDAVAGLQRELDSGATKLSWDAKHGWLPSLLEALHVPASSQTLVFSKTSLQFRHITPSNPRAIYFSDDVYVGSVPGGSKLELTAMDSQLGPVFYTLDQHEVEAPQMLRDRSGECMSCHHSGRTQQVPGLLVRSVFPLPSGQPELRLGSTTVDHQTDFSDRFGGWYVTGSHGHIRHRGNAWLDEEDRDSLDREAGANLEELPERVVSSRLLEDSSDIVALLLLEHQSQMHNWITKASYEARRALHHQAMMNRILERDESYQSESTQRRIQRAANDLTRYLLFCDEATWTDRIEGRDDFQQAFESAGPKDAKGRSLRELDLTDRLLRYSCSYLIYSETFCGLPAPILDAVKEKVTAVLSGDTSDSDYDHLSASMRRSISEILAETHPLFAQSND